MRLFEAFCGYKSQSLALKKYGVNFESVGVSEVDEWAIIASAAIHCEDREPNYPPMKDMLESLISCNIGLNFKTGLTPWVKMAKKNTWTDSEVKRVKRIVKANALIKNYGDITRVNPKAIPDHDLFTYSFPCQDISLAGKQKGLEENSGSRSSLLWECQKIIEAKKPKYLMMENVKNLVGKKHKADFDRWLSVLENLGYQNHWKVINAKHCGIPQNRERVFCVSILGGGDFKFYDDFDSGIRLKDILEDEVDEKYYLSEEKTRGLIDNLESITGKTCIDKSIKNTREIEVANCLTAREDRGVSNRGGEGTAVIEPNKLNMIGMLDIKGNESIRRVYEPGGVCPALTTMQGGNRQPKIVENQLKFVGGIGDKDRVGDGKNLSRNVPTGNRVYDSKGIAVTQTAQGGGLGGATGNYLHQFRIRKLTPRECFRLMGVSDSDIDKILSTGIKNSQLYKLAGNSIVVDCMKFLEQLK